jgi:NAD(P)-dependent dehydrogenase (short-subunit alcohol dehydrogenase family)
VDLEERVRRYAGEVVGDGDLDLITSVVRFGGDRHAAFKVTHTAKPDRTDDVVVHVSALSGAAERAQVAREAAVLAALEGTAAPRLLDVCCEGRWFGTPAMCTEFERHGAIPAEIEQERLARQPVPRWGTPDDVADAVAYLVTDGAGFISGQRLVVNGGMHFG